MENGMIRLEAIEKVYRTDRIETVALANINLTVDAGEFISIMGPSGSGKSTLLNVIGPARRAEPGHASRSTARRSRRYARPRPRAPAQRADRVHLPDLPPDPRPERRSTTWSSRCSTGRMSGARAPAAGRSPRSSASGLASRVHHFPSQLSGGQQQRVAIARAIVGRAELLLADEPTGNLDSPDGRRDHGASSGSSTSDDRTTVVMVTHDPRPAEKTERIVRLFDGRQVS